jgi:non-heme chloroperoxidase
MTFVELSDRTRIRFTERGTGDRTYILVHGWKQSHRLYDRVIASLEKQNRVLAFDQRGMGESDKPNCDYSFDRMAADLAEMLEIFDVKNATLVGWSMGCTTSLSYLSSPQSRVDRLAVLNGPLRLTRTSDFPFALEQEELDGYIQGMESAWPRDEDEFYSDSLLPANRSMARWLLQVGFQTPLDVALKLVRQQASLDHRKTIAGLSIPVLAIYSKFDPYWPVQLGEWIAASAPNGALSLLENSAHCAPLEEPENLCRILEDFVSGSS